MSFLQTMTHADTGPAIYRLAETMACSQLIPPHLRGKVEDVFVALAMADQLGENPVVVMQNIYVVSGRAGWNASYMIARANRSGVFRGRISWRVTGKGDTLSVTAHATLADTGETVEMTADMVMARAEGWTKNAKYQSMPEVMLRYRSATLLIRMYAADVMLGMHTDEELSTLPADTGYSVEQAARAPSTGRRALGLGPAAGTEAMPERAPDRERVVIDAQADEPAAQAAAPTLTPGQVKAIAAVREVGMTEAEVLALTGGRDAPDWSRADLTALSGEVARRRAASTPTPDAEGL